MLRRAALPTTRLWQRRPRGGDFLALHAGVGDVVWAPDLDQQSGPRLDDAVKEIVAATHMPSAPVEVDLTAGGVVGVVGEREGALAVARSLVCQAAVHAGPADLTIGVFCDPGRDEAWSWTTWLPHVRRLGDGSGGQWVSANRARSEGLLRGLRDGIEGHPTPTVLLVLDSDVLTEGRDAPARSLLGHGRPLEGSANPRTTTQVSGIVLAATEEQLPASCTVVLHVRNDAEGTATRPDDLTTVDDVVLAGLDVETARRCATDLARFDDPELVVPGAALPGLVRLPGLLGLEELSPEAIRKSWAEPTGVSTPVGVGEHGAFSLDLVRDGPHGLVGGTTGSGKSEFLRSLVAGLAARNDPTRLTFILIDFKGGAAFATCERLPHTIGTVSNLDEQLADRALRALEAEMDYRQRVFAAAGEGIDNLDAYLATNPEQPMPRLLLVIDEFAMLAKEYPDVLSSLVSVAAVGRTLGVHMILATQRPAGVVNEDILANTNLRVALRVQSRDDSINVVGVPTAAAIGRTQMGRAFVKLGQDDITPVQTALVTGRSEAQSSMLVDVHPVAFGQDGQRRAAGPADDDAPADLDLLIDAIVAANDDAGYAPPRPVWPEPLGERVELAATADPATRRPARRGPDGGDVGAGRPRRRPRRAAPAAGRLGPRARQPAADGHPRQRHQHHAGQPRPHPGRRVPARGPRPAGARPGLARPRAAGRPAAHRGVRRLRRGRARAAGAAAQVRARRARPAPGRPRAAPPDRRPDRRPGRAQGRVRRLRGPQAAGGALPGVLRRARGRAVVRRDHDAGQGRAVRDRRGDHAEVAVPPRRPVRLRGGRRAGQVRPGGRRRALRASPRPACRRTSRRRRPRWPRRWRWSPTAGVRCRPRRPSSASCRSR